MKHYLVTLRLHTTEVRLGIVEANSVEQAASKVGTHLTKDPDCESDELASDLFYAPPSSGPACARRCEVGVVKFYELEEFVSSAQFSERVHQQQSLEEEIGKAL